MDLFCTPFQRGFKNLAPTDKKLLKDNTAVLLDDLRSLQLLLGSTTSFIPRKERQKLINTISLVGVLLPNPPTLDPISLIDTLNKPSKSYIPSSVRQKFYFYVKELIAYLESDQKDSNQILEFTEFDKLMENGTLRKDIHSKLLEEGIFQILHDYQTQTLSDTTGTGTTGFFVKQGKYHYMITSAHVIFKTLTDMELDSPEIKTFNESVDFAIYDDECDIALVKCLNWGKHSNIYRIADSEYWENWDTNIEKDANIIKSGQVTGITIGKFDNASRPMRPNEEYKKMIRVNPNVGTFAEAGDSGSIYFAESKYGFIPIGIHRTTDDEGYGLACNFMYAFKKLLAKAKHLGNIENFQPCQFNSQVNCRLK
ncbi:hypothetical protein HDV01_007572 [Terramyces sp. JEL0728]|nr:hypothetical protein HDV01_007572 [Terramyces sp. JEL0728]